MVITFSNDIAWNHLATYGFVATFRPKREKPNTDTWVSRGRGKEKEFDCRITELGKVSFKENNEELLEKLSEVSGFGNKEDWKLAIANLHGELPDEGYVYLVKKT